MEGQVEKQINERLYEVRTDAHVNIKDIQACFQLHMHIVISIHDYNVTS